MNKYINLDREKTIKALDLNSVYKEELKNIIGFKVLKCDDDKYFPYELFVINKQKNICVWGDYLTESAINKLKKRWFKWVHIGNIILRLEKKTRQTQN
jgi:hypothetical protein